MHVHQLKPIPFNEDITSELWGLSKIENLYPYFYVKYDYPRKDKRLCWKTDFGWWDELIPKVFNARTFSLSTSNFPHVESSDVWDFIAYTEGEYFTNETVIFEISFSESKSIEISDLSVRSGTIILDKSYLFDTCNIADKTVNWMKRNFNGPLICL